MNEKPHYVLRYQVRRIDDYALIGVMYTEDDATTLKDDYEQQWDEPCEVSPTYITMPSF